MARNKIKTATDQRKFTMVYNDFLESKLLNYYEKMVFIAIKKFADNETLKGFPSLNRLHNMTGISRSKIQEVITSLEEKGVLKVEHRTSKEKGHQSNLYTLYDFRELWQTGTDEEVATVIDEHEENRLIQLLETKGYTVIKSKEPVSEPTKAHTQALELNQFDIVNTTPNSAKSQAERYTIDQIKQLYEYDILLVDRDISNQDIEVVINILYDALNTTKDTIRIGGEDKPTMVVIGKLMKLDTEDIKHSVAKFHEQTERIKNVNAYLLTILYRSKEQSYLDLMNQGHNNGDF